MYFLHLSPRLGTRRTLRYLPLLGSKHRHLHWFRWYHTGNSEANVPYHPVHDDLENILGFVLFSKQHRDECYVHVLFSGYLIVQLIRTLQCGNLWLMKYETIMEHLKSYYMNMGAYESQIRYLNKYMCMLWKKRNGLQVNFVCKSII